MEKPFYCRYQDAKTVIIKVQEVETRIDGKIWVLLLLIIRHIIAKDFAYLLPMVRFNQMMKILLLKPIKPLNVC